jgi:peptide/nickel transport system ATP-binding protein
MLLSVQEMTVVFPTQRGLLRAIDGISFQVDRGEVLGVVGESGAGKSLAGAAIMGLLQQPGRIASGQVLLQGQRIDNLTERAYRAVRGRRIAMIFQDPLTSLNPVFSIGWQLVETILTHQAMTPHLARKRAIELLSEVGISAPQERIDSYPHQLSGGMRQRVAIALALAGEPDLIIADEPTTALDVSIQAQIMVLLKRIARERGMAIMLVSHDMGVVAQMADRIMVMYAGRIIETGPVSQMLLHPSHPYTSGLIASIPGLRHNEHRLRQIPGAMPRLHQIPPGCSFNPRCEKKFAPCLDTRPALLPVEQALVACHLYSGAKRQEVVQ